MMVVKDSAIYVAGNILVNIPTFLLMPYLSRKLGVDGFGEIAYYNIYLILFGIIVGFSQDGAVARYYYFYGKRNLKNLALAGHIYSFIASFFIFIVAYFLNLKIIMIIAIITFIQVIIAVQLSLFQCQRQPILYISTQLFSCIMTCVLTILILENIDKNLIENRFLALFFGNLITVFFSYIFFKRQKFKLRLNFLNYKLCFGYIYSFGAPLLLHHLSGFLKGQFDRVLIYDTYDTSALGVYAAGFSLASAFMLIIQSINKATIPYLFNALKNNTINGQDIRRYAILSLIISPVAGAISYAIPESLFVLFLGKGFVGTHYYFCMFILGIGFVPSYLLLVNFLFYHAKNKQISYCSVISTFIYVMILYIASLKGIKYMPIAIVVSNFIIIPILYFQTKKIR
ncbi:oligosaccharide flippase family protein [Campylobacter sp. faydin G-24]|uniref:Oligosaccharide flippase family protein n=1 Tax=Campylobacter anatolicus TaxID=2829105 RepID=A0ABS5HJL0_9BACT|nr:oligosaccharide flippase family protein [Campylobacter anatolicus]MBR8463717.1 oligosaccharide flippase family protein [Campylobacter anatolicus]